MLKRFLPRTLFGRSILIVVMPVILLQVIATFIFYDRHWSNVTRRLAQGVAGDIASVIDARVEFPGEAAKARVREIATRNMGLQVFFLPGEHLPDPIPAVRPYSILENRLWEALAERMDDRPYMIDTKSYPQYVEIRVQLEDGVLMVLTRSKRLFSSTTYIFVMWMIGTSLVLMAIAIAFLRNQMRPVRQLARAAEQFGKGQDVTDFHPGGATEIRRAAAAFLTMKNRIRRQINQRTEMLAGVSHDLRTPLTRMKLQLAMLGESAEIANLRSDVEDMQKMIDGYLAFARGQEGETAVETDLVALLAEVVADARRHGAEVTLETAGDLSLPLRPIAFKRCLTNIVDNARRHGEHIRISACRLERAIKIHIDDDGPGIPEPSLEDVFRPFHRLDKSRNPETGGSGLGLTIARDVARGHGGDLTLSRSPLGGLRASLRLPI